MKHLPLSLALAALLASAAAAPAQNNNLLPKYGPTAPQDIPYARAPAPPQPDFLMPPPFDPNQPSNEVIQGEPNFVKVASLDANDPNLALSQKVGQLLMVRDQKVQGSCSGSLVGPALFLTNFHCVIDTETGAAWQPEELYIVMEHLQDGDWGPEGSIAITQIVLKTDRLLDYALLAINPPLGEKYGYLQVEANPQIIEQTQEVKIIQHPQGRSKEIVTEDTSVVQQNQFLMHYLADTEGGSSGSPVFDLQGEKIVALHHAGIQNKYNEGLVMARIAAEMAFYLPEDEAPSAQIDDTATDTASTASTSQQPGSDRSNSDQPARAAKPNALELLLQKPKQGGDGKPATLGIKPKADPAEQQPANGATGLGAGEGSSGWKSLGLD